LSVAIVAMMDRNGTGVDFPVSTRIFGCAIAPGLQLQFEAIKMWRPLSVRRNLTYDNSLFIFIFL
jgi:hypothetical protein